FVVCDGECRSNYERTGDAQDVLHVSMIWFMIRAQCSRAPSIYALQAVPRNGHSLQKVRPACPKSSSSSCQRNGPGSARRPSVHERKFIRLQQHLREFFPWPGRLPALWRAELFLRRIGRAVIRTQHRAPLERVTVFIAPALHEKIERLA